MFRRTISTLVLVALAAQSLAAVPHCHAGTSSAEHERHHAATPHVHLPFMGHSHSHDHEAPPLEPGLGRVDHDADAIFLSVENLTDAQTPRGFAAELAWGTVGEQAPLLASALAGQRPRWRPPDQVLDGSGDYLVLRNLRI